ncbi:MAG: accessory Sec system translocase SecA2 [Streptococcus orisratti]|uniref:accessory Sec system translocase SecA2 n=1 Tax=Streptococcus orisratti TaxID=114652 RepID=UPI0023536A53|nr:accessory Sec system translocase SecA2 [Streptococcus orisratti]MCI7677086.1 accessory Sec system translocase SecA2 [Streptococcus orisratti]MDY5635817.1 accessory Sec system translocase SecA2 [Streptococcus orisratti]
MKPKKNHSIFNQIKVKKLKKILRKINQLSPVMAKMTDKELQGQTALFRERIAQGESLDSLLPEAFATMREADRRVLGMFPFDVQVLGGIALHQGNIAEMKTGEGKTLTATLPLYLNALSGKGAILVTTNEYLARRDAEEMGKVYEWMGLTIGIGVFEEGIDVPNSEKKAVYDSDIVYTTNSALGFDYLSENLAGSAEGKFLRPFNYVIVDEADAVLLDTAQMPLIISGSPRVQSNLYDIADQFVRTLIEDEEYVLDKDDKVVYLTEQGSHYAEEFFDIEDLYDYRYFEVNRHINLALRAHHLYEKDVDYVVMDDEVKLLDIRSGRILEGTRLQSGIHQAIETKEAVELTQESRSMASVTYQSLFNMFPRLSGMTGTGKIAEDELIETYKLPVIVIPTNSPVQRIDYPDKIYTTLPEKLYATMAYVKELHDKGQPILLISGSVNIADIYSKLLLQEGIPHNVLTAKNVAKEAEIIKEAGRKGAVTVATSLAGRGTDIKLGEGVAELGGLAVIGTERMVNSRVDWQLRGRAGRQGDPGLSQFFVSLEDELLVQHGPQWLRRYFDKHNHDQRKNYGEPLMSWRFRQAIEQAQTVSEDGAVSARNMTIQFDESLRVQRNKIYALRDSLIFSEDNLARKVRQIIESAVNDFITANPDITEAELRRYILENFTYHFKHFSTTFDVSDPEDIKKLLLDIYYQEMETKMWRLETEEKREEFYRLSILKAIDTCWIDQVDNLQQLKSFVSFRQIAQRNSVFEYYQESLDSYEKMEHDVKKLIVRNIMLSTIEGNLEKGLSIYFV